MSLGMVGVSWRVRFHHHQISHGRQQQNLGTPAAKKTHRNLLPNITILELSTQIQHFGISPVHFVLNKLHLEQTPPNCPPQIVPQFASPNCPPN